MFVDSHCHLNYDGLRDDIPGAVARARAAGVGTMLTINTKLREFDEVLAIAHSHPGIFCTVGVHPHEAETDQASVEAIIERTHDPLVVGIGETGLDYFYDNSPRELQQIGFRRHIEASRATQLPIVIHTRDADDDCAAILREEMGKGSFPGVIHCFTASRAFAEVALELGFYISISGIVTFKAAEDLRETVKIIPLDRLLIETDAPFLAPIPHRGRPNEPAFVAYTAAKVAELRGLDVRELGRITTENFFRLFSKATPPAETAA
ncbi:TatD family hydrolase [Govanella unica]|uniref:TatD family hydrolase n=1 Tax=Govanella unica TaxID=2975056 RepID=A0A9X3TXL4_9PROT|nr:TatD family hydrolase [Govania unica]MDA5193850.1 TatD family hydrolase [Govania unica]